jgi:hypothetical protein
MDWNCNVTGTVLEVREAMMIYTDLDPALKSSEENEIYWEKCKQ